jgi:hypothetical protein
MNPLTHEVSRSGLYSPFILKEKLKVVEHGATLINRPLTKE